MPVSVSLHSDISEYPGIHDLAKDFAGYKNKILIPSYFGRDGDYQTPQACKEEEVWHLHLRPGDGRRWYSRLPSYSRTSDKHLVYCRGYTDRDAYLLITILAPNAHKQARNIDRMNDIAKIAEVFRREM